MQSQTQRVIPVSAFAIRNTKHAKKFASIKDQMICYGPNRPIDKAGLFVKWLRVYVYLMTAFIFVLFLVGGTPVITTATACLFTIVIMEILTRIFVPLLRSGYTVYTTDGAVIITIPLTMIVRRVILPRDEMTNIRCDEITFPFYEDCGEFNVDYMGLGIHDDSSRLFEEISKALNSNVYHHD